MASTNPLTVSWIGSVADELALRIAAKLDEITRALDAVEPAPRALPPAQNQQQRPRATSRTRRIAARTAARSRSRVGRRAGTCDVPRATAPRRPEASEVVDLEAVAAGLRARGERDATVVRGRFRRPGTVEIVEHAWVEAGDRVHDPSFEETRKIWPRELYYLAFRATGTDG